MTKILCNHCGKPLKDYLMGCPCRKEVKWRRPYNGRKSKSPKGRWKQYLAKLHQEQQKQAKVKQINQKPINPHGNQNNLPSKK